MTNQIKSLMATIQIRVVGHGPKTEAEAKSLLRHVRVRLAGVVAKEFDAQLYVTEHSDQIVAESYFDPYDHDDFPIRPPTFSYEDLQRMRGGGIAALLEPHASSNC